MRFVPASLEVTAPEARPGRTAFVLHGILGSAMNWRSFSRRLARAHPDWRFVLVDLRNHGDSHGAPPPHTLAACAGDLARMAERIGARPELVVGHSFGGKVALAYAREYREGLRNVWVLDSPIGARDGDPGADEIAGVIAALHEVPQPLARREEVVERLGGMGFSRMLSRWMTTNLRSADDGEGYVWRFDLDGVEAMLDDYFAADFWPLVEGPPPDLRVDLVRAGESERWPPEELGRIRRAAAASDAVRLHTLEGAGHWLHVDDPDGLAALLAEALSG